MKLSFKKSSTFSTIKNLSVISIFTVNILIPVLAYEPVIDNGIATSSLNYLCDPNDAIRSCDITGSKFTAFDTDFDGISINWPYYFSHRDCNGAEGNRLGKPSTLLSVTIPGSYFIADDRLRVAAYQLDFFPFSGSFAIKVGLDPVVGGVIKSTYMHYDFHLLDRFVNAYSPDIDFCRPSSPSRLDITLYLNEYNSYLVVRLPQSPMGRVLATPVRVGLGESIMSALHGKKPSLNLLLYMRSNRANVPGNALKSYITYRKFHWEHKAGNPRGRVRSSNLADDINLFYGAKNYPVRSPLLEKSNAAAALFAVL